MEASCRAILDGNADSVSRAIHNGWPTGVGGQHRHLCLFQGVGPATWLVACLRLLLLLLLRLLLHGGLAGDGSQVDFQEVGQLVDGHPNR